MKSWETIKIKWHIFEYNFHWEGYSFLFRGTLARVAAGIPLVGYLIIFNDGISQYLTFENVTSNEIYASTLTASARLRFVYFGFIFLGIGEIFYRVRRPQVIKLGDTFETYKKKILSFASPRFFSEAHYKIRHSEFDPFTSGGKYYDRDFENFMELCTGAKPGKSIREAYESGKKADWNEAVRRYEPLLTGILEETYFREGRERRISLILAVLLALIGYALLVIPSFELFIRITYSSFNSL
ncbi:hypothetical protein [Thalassococcus profundi]|uniref:hypothetical protein n=1 Tax=Thalassococcus profundi TaxID=2282382 RepID=UPI0011C05577|nr:hypothetical protein [Thalassococcus profundi]